MKAASSKIVSVEHGFDDEGLDPPSPAKPVHLVLAFISTFCPLVIVASLFCLFFSYKDWTISNPPEENSALPINPLDGSTFYTRIRSSKVILTTSWTSNIAQFATAPFMFVFSFLVAVEVVNRHKTSKAENDDAKGLLQGESGSLFSWIISHNRYHPRGNAIRVAAAGAFMSCILTFLLLLGEKLLTGSISSAPHRIYGNVNAIDPDNNSFVLNETCNRTAPISDIYNYTAPPPCSINATTSPWTLTGASETYRILTNGIVNQTGNFSNEDFEALENEQLLGKSASMQIITHVDNRTADQHVLLFNPFSALEGNFSEPEKPVDMTASDLEHFGMDYIAQTTSVVTKCFPITKACGMQNLTESNSSSVPYHCSDIFLGDLNQTPANGIEQLKGWNTSFYDFDNGSPRTTSTAAQLNPFTYNVTAVVNSLDFLGLIDFGDPQGAQGSIVDAGNGRIAFALSCTSHVYNVKYSLVDGNIYHFNASLADPREAAIIKAPLQSGFGSYMLYQQASMAVLLTDITVAEAMELSFSQIGLALGIGAYDNVESLAERLRADIMLTEVPKGPFYFLVVCLCLYAILVLVFTCLAFSMRKRRGVSEAQALLVPKLPFGVTDLIKIIWEKGKAFLRNDKK